MSTTSGAAVDVCIVNQDQDQDQVDVKWRQDSSQDFKNQVKCITCWDWVSHISYT